MALAARLNLRMQKELKLLLTDPPPGATFPSLSSPSSAAASSSSSAPCVTSIDAEIEGPEGTVYEKGVFKLKIQIPDRYPFQPPIVMFATPIYHPNIDNGGRICLDILNLPPKGAWQPSLNISTVLTSIGLLLSEPNPDDGLMQEASREYKYNKQTFEQKARSMTEKYARVGNLEMAQNGQPSQAPQIMDLAESKELTVPTEPFGHCNVSRKRLCGVSKKLSLEASGVDQKRAGMKEANDNLDLTKKEQIKRLLQESELTLTEHSQAHEILKCTKAKLHLGPASVEYYSSLIDGKPDNSPHREPLGVLTSSSKSWTLGQSGFSHHLNSYQREDYQATSKSITKEKHLITSSNSNQVIGEDYEKPCSGSPLSLHLHSSGVCQNMAQPEAVSLQRETHAGVAEVHGNNFARIKHKKLGLAGRRLPTEKLSSDQLRNKENLVPKSSILLPQLTENRNSLFRLSEKSDVGLCYDQCMQESTTCSIGNSIETDQLKTPQFNFNGNKENLTYIQLEMQSGRSPKILRAPYQRTSSSCNDKELQTKESDESFSRSMGNQEDSSSLLDAVVVLDSEDSEDEKAGTARSKLSLARRRLPVKRKS